MNDQGLKPPIRATFYHGDVPEHRPTGPTPHRRTTAHRHITDKELRP